MHFCGALAGDGFVVHRMVTVCGESDGDGFVVRRMVTALFWGVFWTMRADCWEDM